MISASIGFFLCNGVLFLLAYHILSLFEGQVHPIKRFATVFVMVLHALGAVKAVLFFTVPDALTYAANGYIFLFWLFGALPHYFALRRFAKRRVRLERLTHRW